MVFNSYNLMTTIGVLLMKLGTYQHNSALGRKVTNEEAEKLRNYINRQNRTQGEYKYCLFVQDDSMVPTSLADYQNLIDKDKKQADILEKRRIKEKKEQEAEKLARKKKRLAKLKKELGE
jgi:hypothetical protein